MFILSAEILATKIRQDNSICSIFISHKELKISQFADDTSLIYRNLISAQNALLILNEFGILSGLKLNESKTKAVWLGPWKQRTETVADLGKGPPPPPPSLILSKNEEMTEGTKVSRASKSRPGLPLSLRFGSATAKDPSTSCGRKNRLKSWGFISLTIRREIRGNMSIKMSITLKCKVGYLEIAQLSIFGRCLIVKSLGI